MSKRLTAVAVISALVIGVMLGIVWHEPKGMSLPDNVRTWVGFVVVIVGAAVALWQLDMQRRQLAGQQDVLKGEVERNRKRDDLLDKQLEEFTQRALTTERQQADDVDLLPTSTRASDPSTSPPGVRLLCVAEVTNRSRRPIRNAACWIEPEPGDTLQAADTVGKFTEITVAAGAKSRMMMDRADGTRVELVRAGETAGFIFDLNAKEHPKARMTLRFTDDAGLHWQIDHDLHLEKLDNRDDW